MAKFKFLFLAILVTLLPIGCSKDDVEITIPAPLLEGDNLGETIADAEDSGVSEVIENDDGSLTFKMTKSKHKELMDEIEEEITNYFNEVENSVDFPSINEIDYNKSFSKITLVVDQQSFENSLDGLVVLGIGFQAMFYQLFDGVDPDNYEVNITVEDESGSVIDSVIFPDVLEEE